MSRKELIIIPKEYDILCKIYLNYKKHYNSYSELAKSIEETTPNPIFQRVLKLLKQIKIIIVTDINGRSELFDLDADKLFEVIENCDVYKITREVMHKKDKFAITP